jgi:hypothetical protein
VWVLDAALAALLLVLGALELLLRGDMTFAELALLAAAAVPWRSGGSRPCAPRSPRPASTTRTWS